MNAQLAELSARWRSWMASTLDRSGNVCLRMATTLFDWREQIDPLDEPLTPPDTDRIVAGVRARLEAEAVQQPQPCNGSVTVIADALIIADRQAFGNLPPWTLDQGTVITRWSGTH